MLRNNSISIKAVNSWLKIYKTALSLFEEKGYHQTTIRMITTKADCSLGSFYRHFASKEEIILALYENISEQLTQILFDIPEGKIADRFLFLMRKKIEIISPYKKLFSATIGFMMDSDSNIGIVGKETEIIRIKNRTIFKVLIEGSSDKPKTDLKTTQITNSLYGIHLGLLGLWFMDKTQEKENTFTTLKKVSGLLKLLNAFKPVSNYLYSMLDSTFSNTLNLNTTDEHHELSHQILDILFKNRKTTLGHETCEKNPCESCKNIQIEKIQFFISQDLPIHFVLPAFPAKSPNLNKVMGVLPDLGEEIALETLQNICNQIKSIYPNGAKISLCADGRVFSDLVKVSDAQVSDYTKGLGQIIKENGLIDLEILNLEDFINTDGDYNLAREKLISDYAKDISYYEYRIRTNKSFEKLFNGIHRFIIEDQKDFFDTMSKTQFKKYAKTIAIQVIQRSQAWGEVLNEFYPISIRLSIHPHHPHSGKIGIKLTKAHDNWITPWHGVILLTPSEGYMLTKRKDAINLGAELIYKNSKPYYYSLAHEG